MGLRSVVRGLLAAAVLSGGSASAQSDAGGGAPTAGVAPPQGFERGSVAHLAALCAAPPENPRRGEATGICQGFLVGVGQYHAALHPPGSSLPPLFCLPDPPPTLQAAAAAFVTWSRANAQHARERAVDGVVRWARSAYPCPPDRTSDRRGQ
jgi:Rap1a immunity proteins